MVERRRAGEPLAYISGRRAFWNIELHVGPGVLIPRPDSEVLIAVALDHFEGTSGPKRILDLGTGPGTLLLAALDLWPGATGLGVDLSRHALSYAASTRAGSGSSRARLKVGNWAQGISQRFDLILCNPPYVATSAELGRGVAEFEPHEALFASEEGLEAYRALGPQLPRLLERGGLRGGRNRPRPGGRRPILERDGLSSRVANDLGARPRALL